MLKKRSEIERQQDAIRRMLLRVNTQRTTYYPLVAFVGWTQGGVVLDFPTSVETMTHAAAVSALVQMKRSTESMPCGEPVRIHGPFMGHCSPCARELGVAE